MRFRHHEAWANLYNQLSQGDRSQTEGLLQKRIPILLQQAQGMQADFHQKVAFDMSECLKEAKSPAALPMLQQVSRSLFSEKPAFGSFFRGPLVSSVTEDRLQLGDRSALTEYGAWILNFQPRKDTMEMGNMGQALAPLNDNVDSPELKGVADKVFLDSESPWNIDRIAKTDPINLDQFIDNENPNISEVRQSFLEALSDGTVVAKIKMEGAQVTVRSASGMMSLGVQNTAPDPREIPAGSTSPFRVCDAIALSVVQFDGAPTFKLSWTVKYRDEAIAKMSSWLRTASKISKTGLLGRT